MTEAIPVNSTNKLHGYRSRKKLNPRIDMTPMVDLGFLLITFFIFTSALSQQNAMSLVMPKDGGVDTPIKETGALTILAKNNRNIYYYEGSYERRNIRSCSLKELRDVIVRKKSVTPGKDLFVVIKPSKTADYGHVVDILDEMTICDVKRYALTKITPSEEDLMQ